MMKRIVIKMKPTRNLLIGCTGSVASIKLLQLIEQFNAENLAFKINLRVITTNYAKHFIDKLKLPANVQILDDSVEWSSWQQRGDPVLHIDLVKWADLLLIAPLSANSLAKIANGICDNLLLCVVRAWNFSKPLYFCPAMNTRMYEHPITRPQIEILKSWGFYEIPCIIKTLMCGDTGAGAMAEVDTIANIISKALEKIILID